MDIKPGKPLPVVCQNGSAADLERIERNRLLLEALAKLESIDWLDDQQEAPDSAISLVGDMKLLIPLAGLIDKQAELARLTKNIQRHEQEVGRIGAKLANQSFVTRAPAPVVEKEREKLAEAQSALDSLREQFRRIDSI